MKYAIISTWNGEGYSYQNVLDCIKEFATPLERDSFLVSKFAVSDILLNEDNDDSSELSDCNFSYQFNNDQGSWQALEIKPNSYGIVILTNINHAEILPTEEFNVLLNEAIAQADPEEEIEFEEGSCFISAYKGDYDYQFILL
jgi:hypothetical protein